MRVVIADDSVLLREGIAGLLRDAGIDVVATVSTAPALLTAVTNHSPDAAVIDIRMPPTHTDEGLRAARAIRAAQPTVAILLLSQWVYAGHALDLLTATSAGLGYLLKDRIADLDDFLDALHRVANGGSAIDPEVIASLVGVTRPHGPLATLTDRERDVLSRMAEGRSNAAIAKQLFLGRKTIETHVNNIFTKLGLEPASDDNRRVLAVVTWLRTNQPTT
ncbi:response regulator transcription factor [Phytohabitans sp. ZYX-F-186]|uniref:Response regulator transcription factor n=1 Tax=Phytohabitans maris TaxID=3071409 RepID=A0ABU0ZNU4_9ACTN|nr:response regulator transcription factor [Phytohabitans sp. ZYX-F-186]MDQ7907597.1 response regulator transcription factor [Phytohabitans sp. ZYX-F-186]